MWWNLSYVVSPPAVCVSNWCSDTHINVSGNWVFSINETTSTTRRVVYTPFTRYNRLAVSCKQTSNRLSNRFDNRLYGVNGALVLNSITCLSLRDPSNVLRVHVCNTVSLYMTRFQLCQIFSAIDCTVPQNCFHIFIASRLKCFSS